MRFHIFIAAVLVATALVPAVAAADGNETESGPTIGVTLTGDTNQSADPEAVEKIDDNTRLISKEYTDGQMVLVIDSDTDQFVTITDAVAVMQGGTVPRARFALTEGRNRVTFTSSKKRGTAAVTLDTRNTLYAVVVKTGTTWVGGPYDEGDVQTSAISGLLSGIGVTALIAYRRVNGVSEQPERLL